MLPPRRSLGSRSPRRDGARAAAVLLALFLASLPAAPALAASVIVKLRAEGPHAITACAEALTRSGAPFAGASAARSDSLDRLAADLGVRGMRAVFRRPDARPFPVQRRALQRKLREQSGAEAPPDLAHVYRVALAPGVDPRVAAARFRADAHVVWAQPNYAVEVDRLLDDPFLSSTGSWGQGYADQWGVHAIEAPDAWDTTLGEGIVVGVVDTGVDPMHPDFAGNLWVNPGEDLDGDGVAEAEDANGLDDDGNGFVDDLRGWDFQGDGTPGDDGLPIGDADPTDGSGHGSHVAGIIAARGDNGIATAGVAPRATVLPVRVFPPVGGAETAVVWSGVLYAALNGADVINASFSCGSVCRDNPIAEEVVALLARMGVVFVTSAGNTGLDVMLKSPERLRESIVVGSLDPPPGASLSSFSSVGYLVDVVAPGRDVLSLAASVARDFFGARRFVGDLAFRLDGTSMAAPHVSGVAALLLASDPSLTPEEVRAVLRASASDLGAPGHDATFGAGRVSAAAALRAGRPLDLRGRIDAPLPGDTLTGRHEGFAVLGAIAGRDVVAASLELGAGNVPTEWTALPLRRAAIGSSEPGKLALLSLDDLDDGPWVLRLTLVAADGSEVREFTPFSIDRDVPVFVSSAEHEAQAPDVHGRRVVWQSPRAVDEEGATGLDLFAGVFGRTGERALVTEPGDQFGAVLSGRALAWREFGRPGTLERIVRACRFLGLRGACRPFEASAGEGTRGAPQLSDRRLVFAETVGGVASLYACQVGLRACRGGPLAPPVAGSRAPVVDGSRVVWASFANGGGLFTCELGAADACEPLPFFANHAFLEPVALSGRWLALVGLSEDGQSTGLFACEVDLALSYCDSREVATFPSSLEPTADLSGRRLVWHAAGSHGQPDVYTCTLGDVAGCLARALTNDAASQTHPRIDGDHLVWIDDRDGVPRVVSYDLRDARPGRGRGKPHGR